MTSKAPKAPAPATANIESSSPRFPSILVARSNKTRPSELEVFLRSHCGKMKVSPRLSGAHMILQNKESSNIAVRCYYPMDLQRLEESQNSNETPPLSHFRQRHQQDIDGIQAFVLHFQWTVIFFILPTDQYNDQIQDDNSFLRQVMRLLDDTSLVEQQQQQQQPLQNSHCPLHQTKSFTKNPSRLVIRSTTEQAIDYLVSLTDALKPAKHKLRQEFFHRQEQLCFGPNTAIASQNTNRDNDDKTALDRNAAAHAVTTFRQLADRLQFPPGEADLLLRLVGQNSTLSSLVTTVNNKNNSLPVEEQSKRILERFFGATNCRRNEDEPAGRIDQASGHGMNRPSTSDFGTELQSMFPLNTFPGNPTNTSYGNPQFHHQTQDHMVPQQQQHGSKRMFPGPNQMPQPSTQVHPWNEQPHPSLYNHQQPNGMAMMPPHEMPVQYGGPMNNYTVYDDHQQQHAAPPPNSGPFMMGCLLPQTTLAPFHHHPAARFPPLGNTESADRRGPAVRHGGPYHHYHHHSATPYSQGPMM